MTKAGVELNEDEDVFGEDERAVCVWVEFVPGNTRFGWRCIECTVSEWLEGDVSESGSLQPGGNAANGWRWEQSED
jgi:hypothetical protein